MGEKSLWNLSVQSLSDQSIIRGEVDVSPGSIIIPDWLILGPPAPLLPISTGEGYTVYAGGFGIIKA